MGYPAIAALLNQLNGPDIKREGTFSSPRDGSGVSVTDMIDRTHQSGSTLSEEVMKDAYHPSSGKNLQKTA